MAAEEDRVFELEVKVAHQQKLLGELDEVVRRFALRVERLEKRLVELHDSVIARDFGPADEKPPHY